MRSGRGERIKDMLGHRIILKSGREDGTKSILCGYNISLYVRASSPAAYFVHGLN